MDDKIHIENMMSGLNGLVAMLDNKIKESFKNMSPEQAIEFAKSMNGADIPSKIEEIKDAHIKLKKEFKID